MIATAELFRASAIPGRPTSPAERRSETAMLLPRRLVTPSELVESVNRELASRRDCAGLEVQA